MRQSCDGAKPLPCSALIDGATSECNRGTLEGIAVNDAAPKSADIKRFDNDNSVIAVFRSRHPSSRVFIVGYVELIRNAPSTASWR